VRDAMKVNQVGIWLMAVRPKTLGAAWVPVIATAALAFALGQPIEFWIVTCALFASLFIQLATNLFNDAIDFKKGADDATRLGPTRVTQAGLISVGKVSGAALCCSGIALGLGIPLVIQGGAPILILGVVCLFLAYGYTGGPWPLAYLGLGDLFVFIFFGLAAVLGTFFLQSGSLVFPVEIWTLGTQIGLWATVLIAINNFRDSESDRRHKKMTLAARFGATFSRVEITLLIFSPYVLGVLVWPTVGLTWAAYLPLLVLPLAAWIARDVWHLNPSERFNVLLARSGAVHLSSGLLLAAGFMIKALG
jgi:1,4-dihydroxy-2-naphthoate octaprenyltransferase